MRFIDRADAGKKLAQYLSGYVKNPDAVVIALPRGGVVTGFEIARMLHISLDIVVTRKIGAPGQPELAVGALTQEGEPLFNASLMRDLGLTADDVAVIIAQEKKEAQRRLALYRPEREQLDLKDKIVIVTDDGVATGATMRAALVTIRGHNPKKIVLAIPVCPPAELEALRVLVDEVVCLYSPETFWGVGAFYDQFDQVTDAQVVSLMRASDVS
ncbi:phosphoribosyltransferase [Candidatus Dependentiae bacterium HGW-Dependentiae-1]|nr:MAG: phosphoribosyltransferase [Candidatus Dependentiae bacterium HGW-Dependentiae-1]